MLIRINNQMRHKRWGIPKDEAGEWPHKMGQIQRPISNRNEPLVVCLAAVAGKEYQTSSCELACCKEVR